MADEIQVAVWFLVEGAYPRSITGTQLTSARLVGAPEL